MDPRNRFRTQMSRLRIVRNTGLHFTEMIYRTGGFFQDLYPVLFLEQKMIILWICLLH